MTNVRFPAGAASSSYFLGLNGICSQVTNMTFCLTGDVQNVIIADGCDVGIGPCPPTGIQIASCRAFRLFNWCQGEI